MKYLLTFMGMATMLYFGALPAFVPGQPSHRIAQRRQLRWLPASWGRHSGGSHTARPNKPASASKREVGASSGHHWVDDAERAGAAWARRSGTRIERGIAVLYKESLTAVALARRPAAVAPRARSEEPLCDLEALNREYAVLLTRHRRRVSPTAAAQYDAVLFAGCRAFNQELERGDSLYHSPTQPKAELCGMSTELGSMRAHPRRLAQYILAQFDQSPRHAVIQARPDLTHVAISVGNRFFVVRLNSVPTR